MSIALGWRKMQTYNRLINQLSRGSVRSASAAGEERVWTSAVPAPLGPGGAFPLRFGLFMNIPAKPGVSVQLSHFMATGVAFLGLGTQNDVRHHCPGSVEQDLKVHKRRTKGPRREEHGRVLVFRRLSCTPSS